ncbi:MAG TPA: hypothetical protein VIU12_15295 [Chryseolinea sp.]
MNTLLDCEMVEVLTPTPISQTEVAMTNVAHPPKKGYRTIRLPLVESEYDRFLSDRAYARSRLDELYEAFPELFPEAFLWGYAFYGFTEPSIKQETYCRRIRIDQGQAVFTIAPAFIMPYMTGRIQEVDDALFLMRFHVPCWAIAHVFGRDAMYWYRLEQGLGRFSLVGTTVKNPEQLPQDLVADEKHSWLKGQRIYIATTAANDCILGASVAPSASQIDLEKAYGVFASEAQAVDADYAPETVNTDGWPATQNAWKALFDQITVILCFLHAWIKIRDRAKKAFGELGQEVQKRVWDAYHAPSKRGFSQRLRRLREWASTALPKSEMKQKTLDLCNKRDAFSPSYDHLFAHRTSNMVDRLMRFLDRAFFNAQYFHGLPQSAENRVRALALLWNFCPSSPETVKKHGGQSCPAERLNGKCYADNWLENLLVSGSMNGVEQDPQNPL